MNNDNRCEPYQVILALAFVFLGSSSGLLAAELETEFRAGYLTSDNIFLQPSDPVEDSLWSVGATLSYIEETSRSLVDLRAVADYLNYSDTFDSETVGALDALIDYELVDDYFSWHFRNNYGQRLQDPLGAPNPGNRENLNFFTTGPNVDIPMGERYFLGLEGRYSTTRYEDSVNESDRTSGLVQLAMRTDGNAVMSVNAATENIEYVGGATADDFRVNEAFVAYEANNRRNTILVNLGYTEVETDFDNADGFLIRAQWTRLTTDTKTFVITAGSEYSTQGDVFRLSQSNGRAIGDTVDDNTDEVPFQYSYLYSRYNVKGDRTRVSLEVAWSQEDYEYPNQVVLPQDRDVLQGSFSVERDISRKSYVGLDLRFRNRDYKYIDRVDDDVRVIATLGFHFSETLSMFLRYQYQDRSSSDQVDTFTENRAMIGFVYSPVWGR